MTSVVPKVIINALAPTIKSKGKRLTPSCWDLIMTVPPTSDAIGYENIDLVAPSDVMGLQVIESFVIRGETYLKADVLLVGLAPKSGSATWLKNSTVAEWAKLGKSTANFVLLKHLDS